MAEDQSPTTSSCSRWHNIHKLYSSFKAQPAVFGHPVFRHLKNQNTNNGQPRHSYLKYILPFGTVYASEIKQDVEHNQNPDQETSLDKLENRRPVISVSDQDIQSYIEQETGEERLRNMFRKQMDGNVHPDLAGVVQASQLAASIAFFVGVIVGGRNAQIHFLDNRINTAKFETEFQAMRAYRDSVFLGGLKTGIRVCLKCGIFCAMFLTTSQSIATYRNKTSVLEYTAAGGFTGAMLRIHTGLRGISIGGGAGMVLGLVSGALYCLILYACNDMQETRHFRAVHTMLQQEQAAKLSAIAS